jgi:hypothetical protein
MELCRDRAGRFKNQPDSRRALAAKRKAAKAKRKGHKAKGKHGAKRKTAKKK